MPKRWWVGLSALGAAFIGGRAAAQAPDRMSLVCYGEEARLESQPKAGYEWDRDKRRYVPSSGYELTTRDHDTSVAVQIDGDAGRIRPAKNMLPALHADSDDGWYEIRNLSVSADMITGDFKLNGLNRPKLRINRRSGRITLEGLTNFEGTCDPIGADRKF